MTPRLTSSVRSRLTTLETRIAPAVLSDNLFQPSAGTEVAAGSRWLTASFRTDATTGQSLTSATLLLANTVSGAATVSLYSDGGLQPGTLIGTLTSPASYSTTLDNTTFTGSGLSLAANSTYWVVLRADTGSFSWSWTAANTGTGAGYTNTWGDTADAGATWFTSDVFPLQMSVVANPAAPPHVNGVAVNAGQSDTTQRSRVTSVTVMFDTTVTFAGAVADAFTLSRIGGGAVGGFTATAATVGGVTQVTLSGFAGNETNNGSLTDGRYTVVVRANQVSAGGLQLDGNNDGSGGDDYTLNGTTVNGLFRLFGDADGSGVVNAADFGQLRPAFGSSSGDANYRDWLDFDGDGVINAFDFSQFRNRFGAGVP